MLDGVIVVADDEQVQRETVASVLREWGHTVHEADGGQKVLQLVADHAVDLVITDLRMPDLSGLDVVRRVKELQPDVEVVVVTAYGSVEGAVDAMRAGAADFLTKPVDLDHLELLVRRLLSHRDLVRENRALRRRLQESHREFRLLGDAPALREVLARAARAAETDATVLIQGESGTGKELLARTIHDLSGRAAGPFVAVNCAALPETLLESELFGYVKGAFTGADRDHRGRIAQAAGGTLFLDEIGDVPLPVQVKLLRFLQEREYTPVGGERVETADVRVIAATHRDLRALIDEGSFREDLYYRLDVVELRLPPLRERREDIPVLVEHFLRRYAERYGRPARMVSREAMDALLKHDYRGNVRELENIIEQAVVMCRGEVIHTDDLPAAVVHRRGDGGAEPAAGDYEGDLPGFLERLECSIIERTLARFDGNQSATARHLGLTESGLRYKLAKWRQEETRE